ncbi:ATPase family AAA domain-containing protein 5-like isoform X2 [Asterias rubens]|uniref:ATPase family AAA domain-containing protein 5-like isoform X2 n=1 Tax=Asterias rubens TaxID=7604 RepID=UPI0014550666|nr:ATPase family AAA domain-containing protein 5-like isoform X2 [Asterias rubens]
MIGIMSSPPSKASSGQPHADEEGDDANIKSPSSGAVKNSTITSFFKPKTPKLSPENCVIHPGKSRTAQESVRTGDDECQRLLKVSGEGRKEIGEEPRKNDTKKAKSCDTSQRGASVKPNKLQRSKVTHREDEGQKAIGEEPRKSDTKKGKSCDTSQKGASVKPNKLHRSKVTQREENIGIKQAKSEAKAAEDGIQASKPEGKGSQPSNRNEVNYPRNSAFVKQEEKSSKKRKKEDEMDSSLEDFETDSRMKKRAALEDGKTKDANQSSAVSSEKDMILPKSEEVLDKKEDGGPSKIISFLDFLNESLGEEQTPSAPVSSDCGVDSCERADPVQEPNSQSDSCFGTKSHAGNDVQGTSVKGPKTTKRISPEKSKIKTAESDKNVPTKNSSRNKLTTKKSNKTNTHKESIKSLKTVEESPHSKPLTMKETVVKEDKHSIEDSSMGLCNDDSVLTISYSEFLDDGSSCTPAKQSQLPCLSAKKKIVKVEAEIHNQPHLNSLSASVTSDTSLIDLCLSPEETSSKHSNGRTSNVVVNISDLDLRIVCTDEISAPTTSKSKTVYSIFQKKGPTENQTKTDLSTNSKEEAKAEQEISPVKRKRGRPRKKPQDVVASEADDTNDVNQKNNEPLTKELPQKTNKKSSKKALFNDETEAQLTEEEFEGEVSLKRSKRQQLTRRKSIAAEGNGKRCHKKSSKVPDSTVITSTPKSKNNKEIKAQQLLRRAKSRQKNKATTPPSCEVKEMDQSAISRPQSDKQQKVTKAAQLLRRAHSRQIHKTTPACKVTKVDGSSKTISRNDNQKFCSSRQTPEKETKKKKPRDLSEVLGKKAVAKKEVVEDNKVKQTTKRVTVKEKPLPGEVEEKRKPVALASMFTKEGRLALAKKQKSQGSLNLDPCVISMEDETSRDSVRSESSVDWGDRGLSSVILRKESDCDRYYPPFPTISHVFQMDQEMTTDLNWWKLPAPRTFGKFSIKDVIVHSRAGQRPLRLGEFSLCRCIESGVDVSKSFSGHRELGYDLQRLILSQIKEDNPRFPVNRVFKRYLAKRKGEAALPKVSQAPKLKSGLQEDAGFTKLKSEKPSSAKRKSDVPEQRENSKRRKVSQQDSAENSETGVVQRIRLRRRSSRWVIKDDDEEEEEKKEDVAKKSKLRRSSREPQLVASSNGDHNDGGAKNGRALRTRKGKNTAKDTAGKDGKKEGITKMDEAKIQENQTDKLASLAWTEKYQPACSAEMIGNAAAMKRLSGWMMEWKKRTARIKKKMKKQRGRQQNKAFLVLPAEDSDSDFDIWSDSDNSDSDNDDDSLGNSMMLTGPTGCGKTAAVYACARELGFKVFEVNASSKRTGRQILADLGEATQSHHLSTNHYGNNNSSLKSFFPSKSPSKTGDKKEVKKATPIPKAFAAFYKAGAKATSANQNTKTSKATNETAKKAQNKTKPGPKSKEATNQKQPAAISNATESVSEQRLTSTSLILFEDVDVVFDEDKGFLSAINTFMKTTKRPIILTTSDSHFSEAFEECCEMVTFHKPPSSLLATHLQLLCLAENIYASHANLKHVVSLLDRDVRRCWLTTQYWAISGAGRITRSVRIVDPQAQDKTLDKESVVTKTKEPTECTVQSGCFESLLGLCNLTSVNGEIMAMLKAHNLLSVHVRASAAKIFHKEGDTCLLFNHVDSLLPRANCKQYANQGITIDQSQTANEVQATNQRTHQVLNYKLVTSLAAFADDISFMDSHFYSQHDGKKLNGEGWWTSHTKPSITLESSETDVCIAVPEETTASLRGYLEVTSFDRCCRKYREVAKQFESLDTPSNSFSNTHDVPANIDSRLKFKQEDLTKCPEMYSTIVSRLPLNTHCNHHAVAMDYLPILRCICRSEKLREELKIKRRFLHYLESLSLNIKHTDRIALCSIMERSPRPHCEDERIAKLEA